MAISARFELRIDQEKLSSIDEWASRQPDLPSRAEALRRLVDIGLQSGTNKSVHFSDGEKAIIMMMRDLFRGLGIKDPESEPEFLSKVITGGHYWAPVWEMRGIFHDSADSPDDLHHVVDVLDMWDFIEEAYARYSEEQKSKLVELVGSRASDVRFPGFDGNNETELLGIARFFIEEMGRFSRFKGRELNSHRPTYGQYQGMIKIFEGIRPTLVGRGLSVDQMARLLTI